jgi:hypothetical protein
VREVRSAKTVFYSPVIARWNNFLLPLGLVNLIPKALWMLLTAKLRDTYWAYLRRSGRRPRTWDVSPLDFGRTIGSFNLGLAASDDRSLHGVSQARRVLAEREEFTAGVSRQAAALKHMEEELLVARAAVVALETRVCDLEQENRRLMDERDTEKTEAKVGTVDGSAPQFRSDDEPTLKRSSLESRNQVEPSEALEESVWDNLRARAGALETKLSDFKVRAAELEAGLGKLRQDHGRREVRARRESAAER